jgi:hypothetical protein
MGLYKFLHNFLNVSVQIANEMKSQKKISAVGLTEYAQRNYNNSVPFTVRVVTTAVKLMCKYRGGVSGSDMNPNIQFLSDIYSSTQRN